MNIEMIKSKSSFKSPGDFDTVGPPKDDFYIDETSGVEK